MISSQFIQSCQSGDENAIQTLVRTYQRDVFQLALSIIDDGREMRPGSAAPGSASAEADAATRQTFITAIDRMGRYREGTNFETWLYSVAIQVSRKRARSWKRRRWVTGLARRIWNGLSRRSNEPSFYDKPAPPAQEPAADLSATAAQDPRLHPGDVEMWASIRRLNETLRVPIVLRYYHDYPVAEIAHLLNISEGTVHARLDAAREKIGSAGSAAQEETAQASSDASYGEKGSS